MAQKTTIKSDSLGLYVIAGGYIARPFYNTKYNIGDRVLTHHFGGSTNAGVTTPGKKTHNFKRTGKHEIWCTTGIMAHEYPKLVLKDIKEKTKWYEDFVKHTAFLYIEHNSKFVI